MCSLKRRCAATAVLLGVLLAASPVFAEVHNVILIGWDGAQRNHVNECLKRGELPTLKTLKEQGAYVPIKIDEVTDTKAGWSQILTGYRAKVTGVYSNRKYKPIPKGFSIFERLEKHYGPDKIFTGAVIGKKGHVDAERPKKTKLGKGDGAGKGAKSKKVGAGKARKGARKKKPPEGRIVVEDGVRYRVVPGKPWFLAKKGMDLFENGLKLDKVVGTRALELIEKHKDGRFFLFVHFAEVDHSGHKAGENSKAYNDALISNDTWTGKIIARLKELGLHDKTLVYVTADHGFNEGQKNHKSAPHVFLGTNDKKVVRGGLRQDVTPTVYDALGIDVSGFKPPLDGRSLRRAKE